MSNIRHTCVFYNIPTYKTKKKERRKQNQQFLFIYSPLAADTALWEHSLYSLKLRRADLKRIEFAFQNHKLAIKQNV